MTLSDIISSSILEKEEKEALIVALEKCEEDLKREIVHIATECPEIIPELYLNFAAKKYAILKNDLNSFKSVAQKAKKILESL